MTPDPTGHPLDPIREIADEMEADRRAMVQRRCGTCRWWKSYTTADWDTDWGGCEWAKGNLPASMWTDPPEMHMNDGTDCATWEVRT